MTWEIHPAKTVFVKYAEDWDRLNAELYDSHPYFDSRFVGPALDCFANGKEKLCLYRVDGVIEGALILQPIGAGRWSSFRPSQLQITAILIADASLLESLLKTLPGFVWTIEFLAIDPRYSPDFSRLDLNLKKIITAHAWTIGIDRGIAFADYWNQRSKNLKANIRRYFNRTEKEDCVPVLSEVTATAEMNVAVRRFGELESAGWKGAAGTAVSMENRQGTFYAEVLSRFALTNQAAVCELRIANQLAASRLLISNRQMLVVLKTTYDESLARFAPSRLLLYRLLEKQLTNQHGKAIEFYTNATAEQIAWSTCGASVKIIQVFRSDLVAKVYAFLKKIRWVLSGPDVRRGTSGKGALTTAVKSCRALKNQNDSSLKRIKVRHMVRSARSTISSLGLTNGILYLLGQAMKAVSGGRCYLIRYYLVAQPVPNPFVPVCRPSENDRVAEINLQSPIAKAFPRPSSSIQTRLDKGMVCLAATNNETFSGFLWFARGAYDEDEVNCRFVLANPDTMVWDFDVYVEPQFRLGRTFARLWDAANERFASSGIQWSISRISAFNSQSLRSHKRLGIRHLNTLTFVCLGGLQIGLMSCSPYLNICRKGINRPVIVIDSGLG